jgi:protein gp37
VGSKTAIQWTDATWSPVRARVKPDAAKIARAKGYTSLVQIAEKMAGRVGPHCEHVSPECSNCYSGTNNGRCLPNNGTGLPFDRRSRDLVDVFLDEKILMQPLHWKKPRRIFVNSQTDTWGEFVPDGFVDRMVAVAALCERHDFQFLTKRAERVPAYFAFDPMGRDCRERVYNRAYGLSAIWGVSQWPLPNLWLGFSAGDQPHFDERWKYMKALAAAGWLVWCSYEPALGPIDMRQALSEGLRWVVCGGESGPGARTCDLAWIRSIVAQCKTAGVACFVKQVGANPVGWKSYPRLTMKDVVADRKGGDPSEWPEDLRVREMP